MNDFDKYSDLMNLIGYGLAKFDMDFVEKFGFKKPQNLNIDQ